MTTVTFTKILLSDVVEDRIVWVDSSKEILVAWNIRTGQRDVLYTFTEYPRHPVGLSVFEVIIILLRTFDGIWLNLVSLFN